MEKKAYDRPVLTVVTITYLSHLLAGSDPFEDGGGSAGSGNNTSRSASFSTFDGEE